MRSRESFASTLGGFATCPRASRLITRTRSDRGGKMNTLHRRIGAREVGSVGEDGGSRCTRNRLVRSRGVGWAGAHGIRGLENERGEGETERAQSLHVQRCTLFGAASRSGGASTPRSSLRPIPSRRSAFELEGLMLAAAYVPLPGCTPITEGDKGEIDENRAVSVIVYEYTVCSPEYGAARRLCVCCTARRACTRGRVGQNGLF